MSKYFKNFLCYVALRMKRHFQNECIKIYLEYWFISNLIQKLAYIKRVTFVEKKKVLFAAFVFKNIFT